MSDWYKMNPVDWNDGTDDLTLEQEAAYLRLCHAIYITERPIRDNGFVIAGLLRCNERKARRLITELVEAGKIEIIDGHISNRRAVEEISNRNRTRMERKSAGSRGGIESAKARAKSLENNDGLEASASTSDEPEEKREEESRAPLTPRYERRTANPIIVLQNELDAMTAQRWVTHCEDKGRRPSAAQAEEMNLVLREVKARGANAAEAVRFAINKGWTSLGIEYLQNSGFKFPVAAPQQPTVNWRARVEVYLRDGTWAAAWGPKPGDPGCDVPPELLKAQAA